MAVWESEVVILRRGLLGGGSQAVLGVWIGDGVELGIECIERQVGWWEWYDTRFLKSPV